MFLILTLIPYHQLRIYDTTLDGSEISALASGLAPRGVPADSMNCNFDEGRLFPHKLDPYRCERCPFVKCSCFVLQNLAAGTLTRLAMRQARHGSVGRALVLCPTKVRCETTPVSSSSTVRISCLRFLFDDPWLTQVGLHPFSLFIPFFFMSSFSCFLHAFAAHRPTYLLSMVDVWSSCFTDLPSLYLLPGYRFSSFRCSCFLWLVISLCCVLSLY